MEEITNIIKKQKVGYRVFLTIVSLTIWGMVYNLFLLPLKLVTGGTSGIATITYYLYGFDSALMILIINLACLVFSFMYLGKERTMGSVFACLASPLFVKLTAPIAQMISIDTSDILLIILFSGVLCGISNGLMYKSGYSSGGLGIIFQILFQYFKIPIAKASLTTNIIIVGIGAIFFGSTNALYAIILLYINSIVMDKVLLGISNNKAFYIITKKDKEIKDYIIKNLHHTVTTFDVKGGFLENKRQIMLTVIPTREYYRLTEGIKAIDEEAFFVVTDSYQVEGAK